MSHEAFAQGDLRIDVEEHQGVLKLTWTGKSNARNPSQLLAPFFAPLVESARSSGSTLSLDFEKLEHFNSSTITAIILLIQECRSKGLRLSLRFDPRVKWQKLSFDALRVFVKPDGLLELVPIG